MSFKEKLGLTHGWENLKYPEDQRRYVKKFAMSAMPFMVLGTIFNVVFLALVLSHTIDFRKFGKTSAEDLLDFQSRIGFVLNTPHPLYSGCSSVLYNGCYSCERALTSN